MHNFENAVCRGVFAFVEAMTWRQAKPFLDSCAVCPLRKECIETVDPVNNWADGIAGGYLFLNGKPLVKEYERLHPLQRPYADKETLKNYLNSKKKQL